MLASAKHERVTKDWRRSTIICQSDSIAPSTASQQNIVTKDNNKTLTPSQIKRKVYETARNEQPSTNVDSEQRGIVDFSCITSVISKLLCPTCQQSSLTFRTGDKATKGLAVHGLVYCSQCNCPVEGTAGYMCEKGGGTDFVINRQIVFSALVCGLGATSLNNFCEMMDLPGLHHKTFHRKAQNTIYSKLGGGFEHKVFQDAALHVRQVHARQAGLPPDTEAVLDISVSYDGSWLTRGHSSHIGVGCVIDITTGLCIDAHVMCSYCQVCETTGKKISRDKPLEFAAWSLNHSSKCEKNYTGKLYLL